MTRTALRLFPLLVLAALGTGCANPTARVPVMKPAPVNLSAHELVAVDRFAGTPSADTNAVLSEELADALRRAENPMTGRVEYEVLSRAELDNTVTNLRVGTGSKIDDRSMAVLERWRNADVLIRGNVLLYDVEDDVDEIVRRDNRGNVSVEFVRSVAARVTVEIETTQPGAAGDQAFDRVTLDEVVTASRRSRTGPPAPVDYQKLFSQARRNVVSQYLARVLPRQEFVEVELRVADELPDLEIGNGYAQAGDWEAATRSYRQAVDSANNTPGVPPAAKASALYNLGLACGFTNRFDDARELMRESYALDQNKKTLAELQNVERRESDFLELQTQTGAAAKPSR